LPDQYIYQTADRVDPLLSSLSPVIQLLFACFQRLSVIN